jgi:hypothetical protein
VPVVIVGLWNVSHGWFFLPASVLMKQTVVGGASTVPTPAAMLDNVTHAGIPPGLLLLAACALLLLITSSRDDRRSAAGTMVIVFVAATAQHLLFAKFGWLYRYEAYLVGLGIVSVAAFACRVRPAYLGFGQLRTGYTIALAVAMTLIVFGERAFGSHVEAARLAGHVARQQIAIARFVARNYAQQPVAMNDVGAVSYLSSARVLDLMGLGSIEAARLRRAGRFDAAHVNAWLDDRGATVAIVYDDWFTGEAAFQREWVRAGSWATEASSAVESRVAFYGRTRVDAERLRRALHEFERDLAPGVTVSYHLTPQDED